MSRRWILLLAGALALAEAAGAAPVRLAPDFTFPAAGNKSRSLRSVRGQPVILVLARSPRTKNFRRQLKELRRGYSQFASRQALFMAAFQEGEGPVISDVPFTVVNNGGQALANYGVQRDFGIAIIGRDGNVDYLTDHPIPPERMVDVIQNAEPVQQEARRPIER